MQEGIHPEYGPAVFYDRSADKYFLTKSTFLPYAATCRGEPPFYGVHRIRSGQARQGRHRGSLRGQGRGRFCHRRHRATSLQRQEETLKEMDNWPTYYPVSMSKEEVATEMLAH
ncbi:MAG: ZinT/AdcA family metal-binding protein [Bifidobacterium breve]|nr:ZinT/AdcA family metal-binding protein [Bifidobacterium breve]